MASPLSRRMLVFAGLLAAPAATAVTQQKVPLLPAPKTPKAKPDGRLLTLQKFFENNRCPLRYNVTDFIDAADRNHLDWRLLPSISMVESGGGKKYNNNNVLGWVNGKQGFTSVGAGIQAVALRLSSSRLYRHKDVDRILATYNPLPEYARRVKAMMRTIETAGIPGVVIAD
jgi:hypothetical protein